LSTPVVLIVLRCAVNTLIPAFPTFLKTNSDGRTYYLVAETEADMKEWVQVISKIVLQIRREAPKVRPMAPPTRKVFWILGWVDAYATTQFSLSHGQVSTKRYITVESFILSKGLRVSGAVTPMLLRSIQASVLGENSDRITKRIDERGWYDLLDQSSLGLSRARDHAFLTASLLSFGIRFIEHSMSLASILELFSRHGWHFVSAYELSVPLNVKSGTLVPAMVVLFCNERE
jgi:hypothetical protein